MSPPQLSVIIPTHNRPEQTVRAVKSVVSQDVDCEIIVVDDASENLGGVFEHLNDFPQVELIQRPANGGAGAARNTGLDHAKGYFVSFLDSDDFMYPGTLANRLQHAINGDRSSTQKSRLYGCGWREAGDKSRQRIPRPSKRSSDFYASCWFAPGSCIIAPRSLFSGIGGRFDENLRRLEDFELFARLSDKGLELVVDPVVGVEISIGSSGHATQVRAAVALIREKLARMRKSKRIGESEFNAALAYLSYELAAVEFKNGQRLRAGMHFLNSVLRKPRLSRFPGNGWTSQ